MIGVCRGKIGRCNFLICNIFERITPGTVRNPQLLHQLCTVYGILRHRNTGSVLYSTMHTVVLDPGQEDLRWAAI